MAHRRLKIIAERVPARQDRAALDLGFEQAKRGRLGDLERADGAFAKPFGAQGLGRGIEQRADAAEARDKLLGQRLGVAARDGEGEQIFDQFMIEQGRIASSEQAFAKARAVTAGVGCFVPHRGAG